MLRFRKISFFSQVRLNWMNLFKALTSQTEVVPGLVPAEESRDEVIEGEELE